MCLYSKVAIFFAKIPVDIATSNDHIMFTPNQKERYDQAVEKYLAQIVLDSTVIGIIVSGSYVHGEMGPHSDVDIYVITHPDTPERERGNTWIDGVEIEYFQNPPRQIRAYFQREKARPVTAHLLANGILRYDAHPEVKAILQEASIIVHAPPPQWSQVKMELTRYGLDDLRKDLLDCLEGEDWISGRLLAFQLIEACVEGYFASKQQWYEKKKRWRKRLIESDPVFAGLLETAIGTEVFRDQVQAVIRLTEHVEELIGGRRPREWRLRSSLDC